jgi:hypothetical protein
MAYLDINPMIDAIRARPQEFEMVNSYLRHIPSRHLLNFDSRGNAKVHARCDCSMLDVASEQSAEMKTAISAWTVTYWEPLLARRAAERRVIEINREFASHFRPPNFWRRLLAKLRGDERADPILPDMQTQTVQAQTVQAQTSSREMAAAFSRVVDRLDSRPGTERVEPRPTPERETVTV